MKTTPESRQKLRCMSNITELIPKMPLEMVGDLLDDFQELQWFVHEYETSSFADTVHEAAALKENARIMEAAIEGKNAIIAERDSKILNLEIELQAMTKARDSYKDVINNIKVVCAVFAAMYGK